MRIVERNGLQVSEMTLGTVQLGLPYGVANRSGIPTDETSFKILQEAIDGGIVSFDTAAAYGHSETLLGRYFEGRSASLITKIHITSPAGATSAEVEREMQAMVENSLRNLRLTSLPLVLLHNPSVINAHGDSVAAGFQRLKRDGLIGLAGLSVSSNTVEEYRLIGERLYDDVYDAVQLPLNVLDHRPIRNGTLERLRRSGKLVFARSVFLQGLLYLTEDRLPAGLLDAAEPLAKLTELSDRYGVGLSQLAVSFVRDLEGVDSLVIGAETPEQVRANLRLVEGPPLSESLRLKVLELFSSIPDRVITPHLWTTA